MGADKSIEHADQQMEHFRSLLEYIREDQREPFMNIIRLELITAYRKGWNDAETYFDEK